MNAIIGTFTLLSVTTGMVMGCPGPEEVPKRKSEYHDHFFGHFDADGDGKVTRAEFDVGRRVQQLDPKVRGELFARLDKDGNEVIEKKELKPPRDSGSSHSFDMRRMMESVDANKDGKVTLEEFMEGGKLKKFSEKRRKGMFERLDRNKDQVLDHNDRPPRPTPEESRKKFKEFDLDQNGTLSWEEFQKLPHLKFVPKKERRNHFNDLDQDQNGEVSSEELRKAGPPGHGPERKKRKPGEGPRETLLQDDAR
ncbi:MAG: EF-hand domain-containing protein [Verrucomicrobiaceae bacterium]